MGRKPRTWLPNYYYHIVCRGNRRDALFKNDSDFVILFYIFQKVFEQYPFEIASYCIMTNHLHLQLRSEETPISKIMALINKRYASYYNTKYNLTGHVFEKRYYAKIILGEKGMLDVSRYIHLNPVEAQMVQRPEDYRWSSFRFFKENDYTQHYYLNLQPLLDLMAVPLDEKKQAYCAFVMTEE